MSSDSDHCSKQFSCLNCRFSSSSQAGLSVHRTKRHWVKDLSVQSVSVVRSYPEGKKFYCCICENIIVNFPNFKRHFQSVHPTTLLVATGHCSVCKLDFPNAQAVASTAGDNMVFLKRNRLNFANLVLVRRLLGQKLIWSLKVYLMSLNHLLKSPSPNLTVTRLRRLLFAARLDFVQVTISKKDPLVRLVIQDRHRRPRLPSPTMTVPSLSLLHYLPYHPSPNFPSNIKLLRKRCHLFLPTPSHYRQ